MQYDGVIFYYCLIRCFQNSFLIFINPPGISGKKRIDIEISEIYLRPAELVPVGDHITGRVIKINLPEHLLL